MPAPQVKIRPLSPERKLSRGLFEQLSEQIKSGRLAAGARLPTEEELSRAARVSRTVVREAEQCVASRIGLQVEHDCALVPPEELPRVGIATLGREPAHAAHAVAVG